MATCCCGLFAAPPGHRGNPYKPALTKDTVLSYKLGGSDSATTVMRFKIGDISEWEGDAIVNEANGLLEVDNPVSAAVHLAAGPQLMELCRAIPLVDRPQLDNPGVISGRRCALGDVCVTGPANLKVKWVIHAVNHQFRSKQLSDWFLFQSVRNAIMAANEYNCESLAFPCLGLARGYPLEMVVDTMVKELDYRRNRLKTLIVLCPNVETLEAFRDEADKSQYTKVPNTYPEVPYTVPTFG